VISLQGCATYNFGFNDAQMIVDNYRSAQLRIQQGQLP
jgi:hypothetical protein